MGILPVRTSGVARNDDNMHKWRLGGAPSTASAGKRVGQRLIGCRRPHLINVCSRSTEECLSCDTACTLRTANLKAFPWWPFL